MPELPEVETVRLGLNQVTLAQPILGGEVLLERSIAFPSSADKFLTGLQGTLIRHWHRRGKYLLAELQVSAQGVSAGEGLAGGWLGVHLRMTGQLLWVKADEPIAKHCRVRLFFAPDRELRFVDQRTFGQMWWVSPTSEVEAVMTGLGRLGPEPFSPEFSVPYFAQQLRNRQRPIKNALLDQRLVAGVGNIYADEALFLSQIHPQTHCAILQLSEIKRLHAAVIEVLQNAIEARGTTFSDFRDVAGINGNYGGIAWVYDREGDICKVCMTPIQRIKLAGRSAHFCPRCQPWV
ncbi:MAG: DNA-formamidopyrimidine glycosylase [Leptolyngbyaceae cyanobacterium SL_7_1]|nr:DNA-formamidopyrimidine glycosylase [Leptolyngbyaceae cyanobacterium SL_7_1]